MKRLFRTILVPQDSPGTCPKALNRNVYVLLAWPHRYGLLGEKPLEVSSASRWKSGAWKNGSE